MYSKIYNLDSGRWVSTTGQVGRSILNKMTQYLVEKTIGGSGTVQSEYDEVEVEVEEHTLADGSAYYLRSNGAMYDMVTQEFAGTHDVENNTLSHILRVPEYYTSINEALTQAGADRSVVWAISVGEDYNSDEDNEPVIEINFPINIIGRTLGENKVKLLSDIIIENGIQGNVHIENVVISNSEMLSLSPLTLKNVRIEQGNIGIYLMGNESVTTCTNVEVVGARTNGLVVNSGASITFDGPGTIISNNNTQGDPDAYGLLVTDNSTVNLVHPLTKEAVFVDNGNSNWGFTQEATVDQIQTINIPPTLQEPPNTLLIPEEYDTVQKAVTHASNNLDYVWTISIVQGVYNLNGPRNDEEDEEDNEYLVIYFPINIIGRTSVDTEVVFLFGFDISPDLDSNVHIENVVITNTRGYGVMSDSSVTMKDIQIKSCKKGIFLNGYNEDDIYATCTNVKVLNSIGNGVVVTQGASITFDGPDTIISNNNTQNDLNHYGLLVTDNSTVNLVHPLTKEAVFVDNGNSNWGFTQEATVDQIQTINIPLTIQELHNTSSIVEPSPVETSSTETSPVGPSPTETIRKKLKKIKQQEIMYNNSGFLDNTSSHLIRLPEPTIGNFEPKVFYETMSKSSMSSEVQMNDFINKRWIVKYDDKKGLKDNDDVGGYTKALFSHFARHCLFYNKGALKNKQNDLNSAVLKLKKREYDLCGTDGEKILENSDSYMMRSYRESNCYKLNMIKTIRSTDDAAYKMLSAADKETLGDRRLTHKFLKRFDGKATAVWWRVMEKLVIDSHSELARANQELETFEKNLDWVPFVNEGNLLKINPKLDLEGIEKIWKNIDSFFYFVGIILGKFIVQDLPVWTEKKKIQYAREYVPLGELFSLIILNSVDLKHRENKINPELAKQIKEAVFKDEEFSGELLKNITGTLGHSAIKLYTGLELESSCEVGCKLVVTHEEDKVEDEDAVVYERYSLRVGDTVEFVSGKIGQSSNIEVKLENGVVVSLPGNYVSEKVLSEEEQKYGVKTAWLAVFFKGVGMVVNKDTGVTIEELMGNVFRCPFKEGHAILIKLLKEEEQRIKEMVLNLPPSNSNSTWDKKIMTLVLFIEIVEEITEDDDDEEEYKIKLVNLFEYITATKCYPNSIHVGFTDGVYFNAHTCSNGIELPVDIIDWESNYNKQNLKRALFGASLPK